MTRSSMDRGSRIKTGSTTRERSIPMRSWLISARRILRGSSSKVLRSRQSRIIQRV